MSDTGSAGAGWFHAQGDPPGTQRYWNGQEWVGEPQPVPTPSPAAPPPPGPGDSGPAGVPYGMATTFEQPKKKRSVWKWVVGIILAFMLLIGGCTFVLWRAVSGPIDAGNDFLAELQDGDIEGAWALSDPTCFDEGIAALSVFDGVTIEAYRLSGTNVQVDNGNQTGSTSGTITLDGNDVRDIELFMVERDGWRVCGFDIGAASGG